MNKVLLGLMLLSSVSSYANDVVLKVGKSVVIEANTPTKILCESEHSKAPYFCRINFETSFDVERGEMVPSAITINMQNKHVLTDKFVYLRKSFYQIDSGRTEQERANYELENDRILKMAEQELRHLVTRGMCEIH